MSPLLNASDNKALKWHSSNDPILIARNQTVRYQLPSALIVKAVRTKLRPARPSLRQEAVLNVRLVQKALGMTAYREYAVVNLGEYKEGSNFLRAAQRENAEMISSLSDRLMSGDQR